MNTIFAAIMLIVPLTLSWQINRKINIRFNPYSVMVIIWAIMIILATVLGDKIGLYPLEVSGIMISIIFLTFIGIIVYIFGVRSHYPLKATEYQDIDDVILNDDRLIKTLMIISTVLWIIGNIMYFFDLNRYIPLVALPSQLWRWKNLILTGVINENSLRYLGRNLNIIGLIFALNFKINKTKKGFLLLLAYVLVSFIDVRKDTIIISLIYVLIPFVGRKSKSIIKILFPLGAMFIVFFVFTIQELNFGTVNWERIIGIYTFGSFNSLQKALSVGMNSQNNLFMGNSFYFVYSILKYIIPSLAPSGITLETLGSDSTNVYTTLIPVVLDSDNWFEFWSIFFIYSLYIGVIIVVSINYFNRKPSLQSYILYCSVFSCAVRTFYNPTFSYMDILFAFIYMMLISFIAHLGRRR